MRTHPIGTGPFKFVEYKPNQSIKVARNPDYWKPGRPISTASNTPSFANRFDCDPRLRRRQFDMTFPYEVSVPL